MGSSDTRRRQRRQFRFQKIQFCKCKWMNLHYLYSQRRPNNCQVSQHTRQCQCTKIHRHCFHSPLRKRTNTSPQSRHMYLLRHKNGFLSCIRRYLCRWFHHPRIQRGRSTKMSRRNLNNLHFRRNCQDCLRKGSASEKSSHCKIKHKKEWTRMNHSSRM